MSSDVRRTSGLQLRWRAIREIEKQIGSDLAAEWGNRENKLQCATRCDSLLSKFVHVPHFERVNCVDSSVTTQSHTFWLTEIFKKKNIWILKRKISGKSSIFLASSRFISSDAKFLPFKITSVLSHRPKWYINTVQAKLFFTLMVGMCRLPASVCVRLFCLNGWVCVFYFVLHYGDRKCMTCVRADLIC